MAEVDVISAIKRAFMAGTPNTKNAALHGVSRHTVSSYIKKYGWDEEKARVEEKASQKYIEKMAEVKSSEEADVNQDHFSMLDLLRGRLMSALKDNDEESLKEVNQQITAAEKLIKLEREVKGLDLQQKMPKINVPASMRLTIVSPNGSVTMIDSTHIDDAQEKELEAILPNQNESTYGLAKLVASSDEDEDDDIFVEEENRIASFL